MADIDSSKSYENPSYGYGGSTGGPDGPNDGFGGPSGGGGGFGGPSGGGGGFGGPSGGNNRIGFESFDNPGTSMPQMPSVPGPNAGLAYPPPQVLHNMHSGNILMSLTMHTVYGCSPKPT